MRKIEEKLNSKVPQIQIICDYLIKECEHDEHLRERVMLDNKSVDKMYEYILTAVKNKYELVKSGVMVKDEEVYSMAIHHFIESDETLDKEYPNKVTKEEVKKNTVEEMKAKVTPKEQPKEKEQQLSLFDLGVEG